MKAVVLTGHGGTEVLATEERPDPEAGPGQVRIAVRAAGINFADTLARVGLYPDAPKPPCVLGYEVAGEVEAVGEGVDDFKPGDRVDGGDPLRRPGSMVAVDADQVLPLPDRLSFEQGAAFPVNYATAYAALVIMGGLRSGDRVLIHAAAGGVGISATQIARMASAPRSSAPRPPPSTTRSAAQGVEHAIDYRTQDFEEEVRRITGGRGHGRGHRRARPDQLPQGLPAAAPRRPPGHVRALGGLDREGPQHPQGCSSALARMPMATMPWWKSLSVMNENKGVFGLNMLAWWTTEGDIDRAIQPMLDPLESGAAGAGRRRGLPFRARRRGPPVHRRAQEHRQGRAGSLAVPVP